MTSGCGGGGITGGGGGGGGSSAGPCGACKYLRRKCVEGCIFAPYFDAEQGAVHFAAVHRVFGASNASKLLSRIPPQRRFDAVVTLCYEALARVRDPVYGCVSHIISLQQQVVNLQGELAHIQARLSTLQRLPHHLQPHPPVSSDPPPHTHVGPTIISSSSTSTTTASAPYDTAIQPLQQALMTTAMTAPAAAAPSSTFCCNLTDQVAAGGGLPEPLLDDGDDCCDLPALSSELVYKYFSGSKFCSSD